MARTYDLLWDFGENGIVQSPDAAPDLISTSPIAVIAVWRYKYPVTYSRQLGASFSQNPDDGVALRDVPLIIVEDIVNLTVSSDKNSHIGQLSANLLPGANYLEEIFPGDWVAAWILNDSTSLDALIARIKAGEPCNNFDDGFKFLGKASGGPKISIRQLPNGVRTSAYFLHAASFTEFDAAIYYEPYLAGTTAQGALATDWLRYTGQHLNELMVKAPDSKQPLISVNKAIPFFVNVFFGEGVPHNLAAADAPETMTRGLDNPNAFVIPGAIGSILGVTSGTKSNGRCGWNDVCNILIGVQKYQLPNSGAAPMGTAEYKAIQLGQLFAPDGLPVDDNTRLLRCPDDMLGKFLPSLPQFNGQQTVWGILMQYLNPQVNEIFTTLRLGPTGQVMPTLVVRQLPFSSGIIDETYRPKTVPASTQTKQEVKKDTSPIVNQINEPRKLPLTRFADVPRWVIHPILFKDALFGRSDATRFNFIHVYGETGQPNLNLKELLIRDPPISDELDINRSGLRPYIASVNCAPEDATMRRSGDWMYILSDILMGQHLTITGPINLVGIQAPICIGDNVEFDNHIFHIESVTHTYARNMSAGTSTFTTSLNLTHGLKANQLDGRDFSLYSGAAQQDLRTYIGTTSREYTYNEQEPQSAPQPGQSLFSNGTPSLTALDENK
jgi:hypothetical protein